MAMLASGFYILNGSQLLSLVYYYIGYSLCDFVQLLRPYIYFGPGDNTLLGRPKFYYSIISILGNFEILPDFPVYFYSNVRTADFGLGLLFGLGVFYYYFYAFSNCF